MHDLDDGVLEALEEDVQGPPLRAHLADDDPENDGEEHDPQDVRALLEASREADDDRTGLCSRESEMSHSRILDGTDQQNPCQV